MEELPPPRHLIDWQYIDEETWQRCLTRTLEHYRQGKHAWSQAARHRSLGLLFFNPSLRTRTSMELAAVHLGAHATTLVAGQGTWQIEWRDGAVMDGAAAEHIREAIGVLSEYYDALGVRIFASQTDYVQDRDEVLLRAIVRAATVPVINLESAFYHPCQALADAATILEHLGGTVQGRRFVLSWAYHPRPLPMAVPNSALLMAARLGMEVVVAHPPGFELDEGVMARAQADAAAHGGRVTVVHDQAEAFAGAEIIYAKSWGSRLCYTAPDDEAALRARYRHWRVTPELMARTRQAAFMHCLPVRRNVVVDDAVLDGPRAIHLKQAAFRLYAQKAILEYVWHLPPFDS